MSETTQKRIKISLEAYEALSRFKKPGENFSEAVLRLAGRDTSKFK